MMPQAKFLPKIAAATFGTTLALSAPASATPVSAWDYQTGSNFCTGSTRYASSVLVRVKLNGAALFDRDLHGSKNAFAALATCSKAFK